jgi:hypothetical protein
MLSILLYELLSGHAEPLGRFYILEAVVVGPREEEDVPASRPVVASNRVSQDRLEGEPDMRTSVDVRDRGTDVKPFGG